MRRSYPLRMLALLCPLFAGCAAAPLPTATPVATEPTAVWLARGAGRYGEHCASCHGAQGEGQPNWAVTLPDGSLPAPPHDATGHTWHHSDVELLRIIAEGGKFYSPMSKMPAFGAVLGDDDRLAVLAHIKTFWGERELTYQRQQTLQWNAEVAAVTAVPAGSP